MTVYNPQKGRLETISAEFTKDNTTWFNNCRSASDVHMIADINGDILISEFDHTYPILIYGVSRSDVGFDQRKTKLLIRQYK